jgi:hydrogenase maturation protease
VRVLVGGVGYRNLRDHSFGVVLGDALAARSWPTAVTVEDISYNPIAVVQRLEDEPAERRFGLAIVIGAVERGRPAGTLAAYRWNLALPDTAAIQAAVTEAVTGVIALDNTLVIGRYFGALPPLVVVVEIEPAIHEFGDELSPPVADALERARELVTTVALDPDASLRLPEMPLGGGAGAVRLLIPQVGHVDAQGR